MAAYAVFVIYETPDDDRIIEYRRRATKLMMDTPGLRFVAAGTPTSLDGREPPETVLILEFPSVEAATSWYNSPEYKAVAKLRPPGRGVGFVLDASGPLPG